MSKGYSIEVNGLKTIISGLKNYPKELSEQVDALMGNEALDMVDRAVSDVPVDESFLKQSIQPNRKGLMNWEVSAHIGYAPYVEFGTKTKFYNPYPGIDSGIYEGKVGVAGGKSLYEQILAWVIRKGFASQFSVKTRKQVKGSKRSDEQKRNEQTAAYLISRHIAKYGVKPQPFFFKNYFIAVDNLDKGIKQIINNL